GRARTDSEPAATPSQFILGPPSSMPPEQATREKVGPTADVSSLGATLYECLTGRPPFKAASAYDTLLQVLRDDPVPVRRLQPKVPRALEGVCLKGLEKAPARRYATAEELADDLRRFLEGRSTVAYPLPLGRRLLPWGG